MVPKKTVIQLVRQAKQKLEVDLKSSEIHNERQVQTRYDKITKILTEVVEKSLVSDVQNSIDSKLSLETKTMCEKRNELAGKVHKTQKEKTELDGIKQKAIKRQEI